MGRLTLSAPGEPCHRVHRPALQHHGGWLRLSVDARSQLLPGGLIISQKVATLHLGAGILTFFSLSISSHTGEVSPGGGMDVQSLSQTSSQPLWEGRDISHSVLPVMKPEAKAKSGCTDSAPLVGKAAAGSSTR